MMTDQQLLDRDEQSRARKVEALLQQREARAHLYSNCQHCNRAFVSIARLRFHEQLECRKRPV